MAPAFSPSWTPSVSDVAARLDRTLRLGLFSALAIFAPLSAAALALATRVAECARATARLAAAVKSAER
jgi:hypothetical protein